MPNENSDPGYLNSIELYDPSIGVWIVTGNMNYIRVYHTASILTNGNVLITGGEGFFDDDLNSAELYDPSTGVWTVIGNMKNARRYDTASVLINGTVLITGGVGDLIYLYSAELYEP